MSSRRSMDRPTSIYSNHKGFNLYLQAQAMFLYHGHHDQDVAKSLGMNLSAILSSLSRDDGHTMVVAMFDTVNVTSTVQKLKVAASTEDAHVLRGLLLIHYTSNPDLAVELTEHLRTASYIVGNSKKEGTSKDFSSYLIPPSERVRKWFSVRPDQSTALPIAAAHFIPPSLHGKRPASVVPFIKQLASQSSQIFEDTRCIFFTGSFMHSLIENRLIIPSVILPTSNAAASSSSSITTELPPRSKELKRKGSSGRSSSSSRPTIVYAQVAADITRHEIGLNLARILPIDFMLYFGVLEFLSDSARAANRNNANLISMFHSLTNYGRPINTVPAKGCSTFILSELSSLAYSLVATYADAQRLATTVSATSRKSSSPVISQNTKDAIFQHAPKPGSTKSTAHSHFSQRRFGAVKDAGYESLETGKPLSLNWSTQSAALMLFFGCNVSDIAVDPDSPILQNSPGAHRYLRAHFVELSSMIPNWFILVMLSSLVTLSSKMTIKRSLAKKELAKHSAKDDSTEGSAEKDDDSQQSSNGSTSSDEDFEDEEVVAPRKQKKRKRLSEENVDGGGGVIADSEESAKMPSGNVEKKKKLSSKSASTGSTPTTDVPPKKERKKKSIFDNPRMAARKVSLSPPAPVHPPEIPYILPPGAHWVSTTAVATATLPRIVATGFFPTSGQAAYETNGGSTEEDVAEEDNNHPSDKLLVPVSAEDRYNALRQSLLNESGSSSESSEIDLNDQVLLKRLATRVSGEDIEQLRSSMNMSQQHVIPHDEQVGVGMDVDPQQVGDSQNDFENNGMMQLYEATYMDIQQAQYSFTNDILEQYVSQPSSPVTQSQQSSSTLQRQNGPPLNVTVGRVVELGFQNGIVEEDASLPRRQHSSQQRAGEWTAPYHQHDNVDSDSTTATAMYGGITEEEFDEYGLRTTSAEITDGCMAVDHHGQVIAPPYNVVEQNHSQTTQSAQYTNFEASVLPNSCITTFDSKSSICPAVPVLCAPTGQDSVVQIKANTMPVKKLQFKKKVVVV